MSLAEPLWTIDEVAEYLRTSRVAVYHQVARGQLPGVVRFGRRVLIKKSVLLKALDGTSSDRVGK